MSFAISICFLLLAVASFCTCSQHGVQMRLTKKGMDYTVNVGIDIMKKDLKKEKISKSGRYEKIEYKVQNLEIGELNFGHYELDPIEGVGLKGVVSDIDVGATADFEFTYHSWITYHDKTSLEVTAKKIDFSLELNIGSDKGGHPTISVLQCSANVGSIDLHFKGSSMAWIYNLVSSKIESEMESTFKELLCQLAVKEINTKAKEELETFPVVRKIDSYAEIDYRLTEPPKFTNSYMDALLKGEFKSSKDPEESDTPIPDMRTNSDHEKMVYFWISDFTMNTAGDVYHQANKLQVTANAWDPKVPEEIKSLLQTSKFTLLFPKIIVQYGSQPMGVHVYSYEPPHVTITKQDANFHLYAITEFSIQTKHLFTFKFDIKASASLGVRETNVTAHIDNFSYDASVVNSTLGQPIISLDNVFVRSLLETLIINKGNDFLDQGFPLPKVDEVTFDDFGVELQKDALRIGTDLKYNKT